jgi:thiopeptide-type bacteriocin biosynthesis protein
MKRLQQPVARHDSVDQHWIQLNVGLARRGGLALPAARAVFDEFAPLVEQWRAARELQWFFFMRKPPDIRLRFRVPTSHDIRPALDAAIARLQREGRVTTFFYSSYEPETERFGGPDGMRSVHAYFDVDTRAWLHLDALERQERRRLAPERLLPALVHDLFLRGAAGHDHLLAASWRSLANEIATPTVPSPPAMAPAALDELSAVVGPGDEHECLACFAQANARLADELVELAGRDRLARSISDVLAAAALFSFHRHGFSGERSAPLVAAAMAALEIDASA